MSLHREAMSLPGSALVPTLILQPHHRVKCVLPPPDGIPLLGRLRGLLTNKCSWECRMQKDVQEYKQDQISRPR